VEDYLIIFHEMHFLIDFHEFWSYKQFYYTSELNETLIFGSLGFGLYGFCISALACGDVGGGGAHGGAGLRHRHLHAEPGEKKIFIQFDILGFHD